jgi:hypothetical protein
VSNTSNVIQWYSLLEQTLNKHYLFTLFLTWECCLFSLVIKKTKIIIKRQIRKLKLHKTTCQLMQCLGITFQNLPWHVFPCINGQGPKCTYTNFPCTTMVVQISLWKISPTPELPRELHLAFIIMCPENTLCTSKEIIMSWMFKFPAHKNPSLILQAFWSSPWPYHNIWKNKGVCHTVALP